MMLSGGFAKVIDVRPALRTPSPLFESGGKSVLAAAR
jgi:hypothetical protein